MGIWSASPDTSRNAIADLGDVWKAKRGGASFIAGRSEAASSAIQTKRASIPAPIVPQPRAAGPWPEGILEHHPDLGEAMTGRTLSHYALERCLGAGGMGKVYQARDLALGRAAAVKVLQEGMAPEFRA